MSQEKISASQLESVREGLRMAQPPDPAKLAEESAHLESLEEKGWGERTAGYLKLVGPGYMQSAMTLGGGTAAASLFAGAAFGYQLLWVAPVAMFFGVVMLSAVSHQTLSTGARPFDAMRRFAGAPFAWAWALGALISSVIWHFPQYALGASVLVDMGAGAGMELNPTAMGFVILALAVSLSMLYGTTPALIRWYERILKWMVWGIVLCFAIVVINTGVDWGALFSGFFAFRIPGEVNGVAATTVIISGLAAAVGVNMLFLYPYSLLARGWGRSHRRLARFDLLTGMFIPYALATTLMVVAVANTIHAEGTFTDTSLKPIQASLALRSTLGDFVGRYVFDLGILGMALSSITLQMLCAGFVCNQLFGWSVGTAKYRLATLIPIPGVLGPYYWSDIAVWVAVPTNIICGLFIPLAYVGFILLQRNRNYLGDDTPTGTKGKAWIGGMILATLTLVVGLSWAVYTKGPGYFTKLKDAFSGSENAVERTEEPRRPRRPR